MKKNEYFKYDSYFIKGEKLNLSEYTKLFLINRGLPIKVLGYIPIYPLPVFEKFIYQEVEYYKIAYLSWRTSGVQSFLCLESDDKKNLLWKIWFDDDDVSGDPYILNKNLDSFCFFVEKIQDFVDKYSEKIDKNIRIERKEIQDDYDNLLITLKSNDEIGFHSKIWEDVHLDFPNIVFGDYFTGVAYGETDWFTEDIDTNNNFNDDDLPF